VLAVRPASVAVATVLAQGLATAAGATGLLYLLRPNAAAGPIPVPDTLPLDELSNRAATSLPLLALVWIATASAVLLLSPPRARKPLGFAVASFCCSFAGSVVSLRVVRQTTTIDALTAAATIPATYLEALLAAGTCILLLRVGAATHFRSHHRPSAPRAPH
jgi:hypothetical protein